MLTIITATAIALSLASVVLMKSRISSPAQLDQQRSPLLTVGVQIICGDCAGEGDRPVRTYMSRYGTCAQCGGTSYLLASSVAAYSALLRAARLREVQGPSRRGRVIPFEVAVSRASRSEKIAV